MGEFFRLLPIFLQGSARQTNILIESDSFLDPILMPDFPAPMGSGFSRMAFGRSRNLPGKSDDRFVGRDKKLELHLFEFAGTENKVTWSNFVAKSLSDL